jgi:5'-3' exonuclease
MGIPSFYKHLVKTNPSLIKQKLGDKVAVLALDFNCAIYHCLSKLQKKTIYDPKNRIDFENKLIQSVIQYIVKLRDHVQPTDLLYIAVDGVVPIAKIKQQRLRRFKSVWMGLEEYKIKGSGVVGWDRNAITPGTDFMEKLTKRLEEWAKGVLDIKIIVSGVNETGEGEQKIMTYLRENAPSGEVIVYGLDADLIVLCLWHRHQYGWSFKLLREEVEMTGGVKLDSFNDETFLYFDINHLCDVLKQKWRVDLCDFVGVMTFLGNDFVPHGMTLCIKDDGIDRLMSILERIDKPLIVIHNGIWTYDMAVLNEVLSVVSSNEEKWLKTGVGKKLKMSVHGYSRGSGDVSESEKQMAALNNLPLVWKVERSIVNYSEETGFVLRNDWKEKYYCDFLWNAKSDDVVKEWLYGIQWVLDYYTGCRNVDMLWYFPWYLPPLFSDILRVCKDFDAQFLCQIGKHNSECTSVNPINPISQLLMVLPIESYALLPSRLRRLAFQHPEYFPKEWGFFSAGRRQLWECEPLIPMMPFSIIRNFLQKMK